MVVYAALLRGINVGGNRIIRMAALRALCEAEGYEQPRTLLQSGNLVFAAASRAPARVARTLESAIEATFGFPVDVMIRTSAELTAAIDGNPFADAAASDPRRLVITFLKGEPLPDAVARLRAEHDGPEAIAAGDRVLYLHYPDGIGVSKLTNAVIEKRLGVRGTARNWNTVTALHEMVKTSSDR